MSRPVLLIAGGSRGIGAATARLAGARGYDVAVNYKSNAKAAASVVEAVKNRAARRSRCRATWRSRPTSSACSTKPRARSGRSRISSTSAGIIGKNSRLDDGERRDHPRGARRQSLSAASSARARRCAACRPRKAARAGRSC